MSSTQKHKVVGCWRVHREPPFVWRRGSVERRYERDRFVIGDIGPVWEHVSLGRRKRSIYTLFRRRYYLGVDGHGANNCVEYDPYTHKLVFFEDRWSTRKLVKPRWSSREHFKEFFKKYGWRALEAPGLPEVLRAVFKEILKQLGVTAQTEASRVPEQLEWQRKPVTEATLEILSATEAPSTLEKLSDYEKDIERFFVGLEEQPKWMEHLHEKDIEMFSAALEKRTIWGVYLYHFKPSAYTLTITTPLFRAVVKYDSSTKQLQMFGVRAATKEDLRRVLDAPGLPAHYSAVVGEILERVERELPKSLEWKRVEPGSKEGPETFWVGDIHWWLLELEHLKTNEYRILLSAEWYGGTSWYDPSTKRLSIPILCPPEAFREHVRTALLGPGLPARHVAALEEALKQAEKWRASEHVSQR